jgi:hypothetical protein
MIFNLNAMLVGLRLIKNNYFDIILLNLIHGIH